MEEKKKEKKDFVWEGSTYIWWITKLKQYQGNISGARDSRFPWLTRVPDAFFLC